jgi:hypothetical protein
MRTPTHVITSQGQYFGEVGHIIAGSTQPCESDVFNPQHKKARFYST